MKNIVETAIETGNLKTLVKAVQEAGLFDTLTGDGPFTIFAPSDKAFAKLSAKEMDELLQNKERLTEILTYHVIPEKVMAESIIQQSKTPTANGQDLTINTVKGVKINDASVIRTDIECTNGVIHIIDSVLMPK